MKALFQPYLTTATNYYSGTTKFKLPQDFKPMGFYADLHEYTTSKESFFPHSSALEYLDQQDIIDKHTNFLLFLSCINEEY